MYVRDPRVGADMTLQLYAFSRAVEFSLSGFDQSSWKNYFREILPPISEISKMSNNSLFLSSDDSSSTTHLADDKKELDLFYPPGELYDDLIACETEDRADFLIDHLARRLAICYEAGGVPAGIRSLVQVIHT